MANAIVVALRVTLFTLALTGLAYPLAATGLSQLLFHAKANGSLVELNGKVVGSELIGQAFSNPGYFQPRPSAAGEKGYDATSSSGSNLGTTSQKLKDRISQDLTRLKKENAAAPDDVPDELVTASASGLDPHLSPEAAGWQIARIARTRGVAPERIRLTLEAHIEGRDLGLLGEPRINVLTLNLAMDKQFGQPPEPPPPALQGSANPASGSPPVPGSVVPAPHP